MAYFCAYSLKWFFHCLNTNNLIPWTLFPEISSHLNHTQTRSVINLLIFTFFKVIPYDVLNYISWIFHLFEQVLLTWHLELHIILTLKQLRTPACYTSTKSWRGYIFTAVCLCVSVCLSVCPALLVNKIPAKRMHRFGRGFR